MLTTSGADEYRVTLAIQPVSARSGELEVGLRRQVTTQEEKTYNWLPLLRPAAALEIRYFDSAPECVDRALERCEYPAGHGARAALAQGR